MIGSAVQAVRRAFWSEAGLWVSSVIMVAAFIVMFSATVTFVVSTVYAAIASYTSGAILIVAVLIVGLAFYRTLNDSWMDDELCGKSNVENSRP